MKRSKTTWARDSAVIVSVLLCMFLVFCNSANSQQNDLPESFSLTVGVSPQRAGVRDYFTLLKVGEDGQLFFRSLSGTPANLSFTDFFEVELDPTDLEALFRKTRVFIDSQNANRGEKRGLMNGWDFRVEISHQSKNSVVRYHVEQSATLEGVEKAFFFKEHWDGQLALDPSIGEILRESLGKPAFEFLESSIRFSHSESKKWIPDQCKLIVTSIDESKGQMSDLTVPISFPQGVTPASFTFKYAFHESLRTKPLGVISFGNYVGRYQCKTLFPSRRLGKRRKRSDGDGDKSDGNVDRSSKRK